MLAVIIGCFTAWGIAHELLVHPITLNWNPPALGNTHALVPATAILHNPKPTPADQKMADDLFNEFGGKIPRDVLEYLVMTLGASVLTAAMIRCLYHSGYLELSQYRWRPLEKNNVDAWKNIIEHLKPQDLEGAWKEMNPSQVDPTTITSTGSVSNGQHDKEVEDGLNAIKKLIKGISGKISDLDNRIPRATDATKLQEMLDLKKGLQKLSNIYTKLQNFIQSKIAPGSPSPDQWSDRGKLPLVEDLLQASTCKVPDAKFFSK